MSNPPAFQLYAADFYMDTLTWDTDDIGVYFCLLMAEWVNGPLDDDTRKLAKIAKKTHQKFIKNWSKISQKFSKLDTGKLVNMRLEAEREKQAKYIESQREKGKKRAEKRWNNDSRGYNPATKRLQPKNGSSSSLESKILEDSLPSANKSTERREGGGENSRSPLPRGSLSGTKISSSLALTPEREAYARAKGLNGNIALVWEKFVLHHRSRGTVLEDWNAAWQKWVLDELSLGKSNGGIPGEKAPDDERLKERLDEIAKRKGVTS